MLLIPALWLTPVDGQSQASKKLYFNHLNTANGLSQSQCFFIYTDSHGFCWLSSTDGIMRYDGQDIKSYPIPDAHFSPNVQSNIYEDTNGDLWFSTVDAVVAYRRTPDVLEPYALWEADSVKRQDNIYRVFHFEPDKNRLWVVRDGILYWVNTRMLADSNSRKKAVQYVGAIQGDRCFVVCDSVGAVCTLYTFVRSMGGKSGFWKYHVRHDSLVLAGCYFDGNNNLPALSIKSLCPMANGDVWLATALGLVCYNPAKGPPGYFKTLPSGKQFAVAYGIAPDGEDKIWVGTNLGLALFSISNNRFIEFYPIKENSPDAPAGAVYDLYLDPNRVLWCTINMVGVDFTALEKPKFDIFTVPEKHDPPFVPVDIEEDQLGNFWFGSDKNYLKRWNGAGLNPGNWAEIPEKYVLIKQLNYSRMLVANWTSAFVLDPTGKRYQIVDETGQPFGLSDAFVDARQNVIWAIRSDDTGGIWQIPLKNKNTYQAVQFKSRVLDDQYNRIFIDSKNRLYLAEDYKLLRIYTMANDQISLLKETAVSGWTKYILEDDKYIWAAGTYGLCRIEKDNLADTLIQEKDGLPNNSVYAILKERDSRLLWISTNQGLVRFHPDTFGFRQFSLADGLQDYEFNYESCLLDSEGKMWFGGIKGVNVFDPAGITDLTTTPPVYITRIRINDEPYTPLKNVTLLDSLILEPNENTFSFDFAALEFSDPQNTKLRYQLRYAKDNRPYDPDWLYCETAKGFARYAKLKHGHYYFYVQGANSDGVWSDKVRKIYIRVKPRFTETLEFFILLAVSLIALGYIGVRLYIANKLRLKNLQLREQSLHIEKQEALTQERNRIAGEMHDDLGGGLTSIRMLSERVQNKIERPDVRKSVDKISAYSQDLVLKMSEIIWAMNSNFDTLDNLISYIRNYAVKYLDENNIRCSVQRPDDIPDISISGERRRNLYLAVKESLHNIVKHAQADRVNLEFTLNKHLAVQIHDNGVGIDPDKMNQFGNGLYNMRKRMESVGGSMQLEQQNGTRILFKIPVKPDNP